MTNTNTNYDKKKLSRCITDIYYRAADDPLPLEYRKIQKHIQIQKQIMTNTKTNYDKYKYK